MGRITKKTIAYESQGSMTNWHNNHKDTVVAVNMAVFRRFFITSRDLSKFKLEGTQNLFLVTQIESSP